MNKYQEILSKFITTNHIKTSNEGYRDDSPDRFNSELIIPSGNITMKNRDGSPINRIIKGVDNLGNEKIMHPGQDYEFPGDWVKETPIAQKGKTIIVDSKNDPRYKAYQDSLNLYNSYRKVEKALKTQGYTTEGLSKSGSMPIKRKSGVEYEKMFTEDSDNNKNNVIKNNDGTYNVRDFENMMVNKTLPYQLFNKNIEPLHVRRYHDDNIYTYTNTPEYMEVNGVKANASPLRIDVRNVYNYSNVKPKQQVIIGKKQAPKSSTSAPSNVVKPYSKDTPQVENINLQPVGIQNDFNIEASLPNIQQPIRQPKYYDVKDTINQNFGGRETDYKWYPENGQPLQELSPNNTRKLTPHYQEGDRKSVV